MKVPRCFRGRNIVAAAAVGLLAGMVGHAQPDRSVLLVGIARGKAQIRVSADGPFAIMEPNRDKWRPFEDPQTITLDWVRGSGTLVHKQGAGVFSFEEMQGARITLITESGEREELEAPLHIMPRGASHLKYLDAAAGGAASYRGDFQVFVQPAGMTLVNMVGIEDYLRGVVPCEMSKRYPAEALKAQAVAARSYALAAGDRHQGQGFDLCDYEHCQVYRGISSETPATNQAVEETRGEVLTCNGRVLAAPYSAVCGGFTEEPAGGNSCLHSQPDFDEALGLNMRPPTGEDEWRAFFKQAPPANCCQPKWCPLDRFRWVEVRRRDELEKSLADVVNVGTLLSLRPLERGRSGRITRLEVRGARGRSVLSPELVIRKALGGLKSSAFVADAFAEGDAPPVVFVFWGAGMGHGAGMCQVGAAGQAEKGKSYREILKWYFPDCTLERKY